MPKVDDLVLLRVKVSRPTPRSQERYRHFKGTVYEIIAIAAVGKCPQEYQSVADYYTCVHTETGRWHDVIPGGDGVWLFPSLEYPCVLYRAAGDRSGTVWARPLENFMEVLSGAEGQQCCRFEKL